MEMSWEQFYGDSRHVTNASIICRDGVINTHKLVLANISDLLRCILRDIPFGDSATIYLTDFRKVSVEQYLCDAIQRKETDEKKLHKLLQLNQNHDSVKVEREADFEAVKLNTRGTVISKDEPNNSEVKVEAQSSNEQNSSDEDGDNNGDNNEDADSDYDEDFKGKQLKRKVKEGPVSSSKKARVSTSKKSKEFTLLNPEELDAFDRAMDEKIRGMEDEKIEDPSTTSELAFNKRMDKKIRYEKAYAEVKSGRAKSYSEAARRFGVCPQTIRKDDDFLQSEAEKRFGVGLKSEARNLDDESFIQNYDKLWKDGDICDMDPEELAELDKRTEEVIEGLKRERITNPSRPQDLAFNKNIDKKIRYERALAGVKSGRVRSCREAARMFGVCRQSLQNCLKSGKSFTGSGRHMLKFTKEEEGTIIARANSIIEDGQQLTKDALAKLILEEAEVVKINFPDREETMNWIVQSHFQRFVENFAIRNNINGADFKSQREAKKLFECEVCYQSFGSVSYLIQHKKTLHEFLYTDEDFPVKKPKREKKWECDICYKKFTTKQSVQQHQKKQHDFFFTQ